MARTCDSATLNVNFFDGMISIPVWDHVTACNPPQVPDQLLGPN